MTPALLFILMTIFIDAMGVGLLFPVMPDLIREVNGGDIPTAALWGGLLSTVYAVMAFGFGPLLGNLSDRYGRRPVLLWALVVLTLDYLIMAVAGTIWLLLAGRMLGGITAATVATANAYIADISRREDKAANFGLAGAALGMGFVFGPVIGGGLAEFGTRAPFYAAAALAALNAAVGYVVLRETVNDRIRRPFDWRRANPFGAFKSLSRLPGLLPLLSVFFIYQLAFGIYPAIWAFYTGLRFGWDPAMVGLSLGLFGIALAIVQGGLVRPVLRLLGERGAVIYGHAADVIVFVLIGVVSSGFWLLVLTPLAALPAFLTPALQSIMSKAVDDNAQGELQGAITSVSSVAMIFSPMIMTGTFSWFSRDTAPIYAPGAPFFLAAAMIGAGLVLFLRLRLPEPKSVTQEADPPASTP